MKRMLTGLCALPLVAALLLAGSSAPASAHTGDLKASGQCQPDGTFLVTYTLNLTNSNLSSQTMWRIGDTDFDGTPNSATGMDRGPIARTGPGTFVLGTETYPGDYVGPGNWVYAFTRWSDGFTKGSDGRMDRIEANCKKPDVKDASATLSTTPATCDAGETLVLGATNHATWGTPTLTEGPGDYSVTATADSGHLFSNGSPTQTFTGTLAGKDTSKSCNPPTPHNKRVKTRVKIIDKCNCYRDKVMFFANRAHVTVKKSHPSNRVFIFRVVGKETPSGGRYLLPSRVGGHSGWAPSQVYKFKTKNQICPCKKRGDCKEKYPHFTPPPDHCRTKGGTCH